MIFLLRMIPWHSFAWQWSLGKLVFRAAALESERNVTSLLSSVDQELR